MQIDHTRAGRRDLTPEPFASRSLRQPASPSEAAEASLAADSAKPATMVYAPIKGRGTAWAIEHRFTTANRETFDDGWGTLEQAAREERMAPGTQVIEEQVRSILSGNESPDIAFDLSINPYRGCEHVIYGPTMCD